MLNNKGRLPVGIATFLFLTGVFLILLLLPLPLDQSLIYILAAIVFIIAFINTDVALVLIILSMLLSPEIRAGAVADRNVIIRADDIFLFVIFLGWLSKMAIHKEFGILKRTPLNLLMVVYIFICVLSSLIGIIAGNTDFRRAVFYNIKYFEYFLIFFMVSNNLRNIRQAKTLIFFILLTCFIVCIAAWAQIPSGERLTAPFESEGGEPNTFAAYLLLMIGLAMGLLFYIQGRKERFVLLSLIILAVVAFVLTMSREGWLGFFPMFLVFIIFHKRLRYPLILLMAVGLVCMPFVLPKKVHERFQDTFSSERSYRLFGKTINVSESAAARIDSWQIAFKQLGKTPVLGVGVPSASVIDNQYARVLTETGLAGFIAFMLLLFVLFRNVLIAYKEVNDPFVKGVSLGFLAGFIGILFQSFAAAVFILIRVMEPFWLLAAIVIALPEIVPNVAEVTTVE